MSDVPDPATIDRVVRSLSLDAAVAPRALVLRTGDGVAVAGGLAHGAYEELLQFDSGALGLAFDLRADSVGIVLLTNADRVQAGEGVRSTGSLPDVPVGESLFGRVLDPLGNPMDGNGRIPPLERWPLFRPALPLVEREAVDRPLRTGILVLDSAVPIGRGQRELIVGDRNVGKTALALDIVVAQRGADVVCVYVVIGQPVSRILALRQVLADAGALENSIIVSADASMTAGMRYLAPYAGATIAEWFRERGQDALVVYDDLTKHADAYRELSLLIDRPPGREAFPGDVFYIHAELLERAAPRSRSVGGGSVTALPIIETTEGDIAAYIPTNVISITDGQIYLDSRRFARSQRPAVDIGRSVSRIGGAAQSAPLRAATRNLRILHARFEELESLAQVGLELEAGVETELARGRLLRELLRQPRLSPMRVDEQILSVLAVSEGWLDGVPVDQAHPIVRNAYARTAAGDPGLLELLEGRELPQGDWRERLARFVREEAAPYAKGEA